MSAVETDIRAIIEKAEGGVDLTRAEIRMLLDISDPAELDLLFSAADRARKKIAGDEVHLRGLVEISNYCRRNCRYCGLRKGNSQLERYRMTDGEIVGAVCEAVRAGCRTAVLQSGEDTALTVDRVARIVKMIKSACDAAITLSFGEYSLSDYRKMREAGADRYLLKHETIDSELYRSLHPGMSYESRIRCLGRLKEAGFQVGTGIITGLPGQTVESLAEDLMFMKRMNADMGGIGPFIPHPDTPLKNAERGTLESTLKIVAAARLMMPGLHIPATTAAGSIRKGGRRLALQCGANVIMPNVTPIEYRRLYQIYPNRAGSENSPADNIANAREMIKSLGRKIAPGYGHGAGGGSDERRVS